MRDPNRIDRIIEKLRLRWKQDPDLRLGQLVVNLSRVPYEGVNSPDVFFTEDNMIERVLNAELLAPETVDE